MDSHRRRFPASSLLSGVLSYFSAARVCGIAGVFTGLSLVGLEAAEDKAGEPAAGREAEKTKSFVWKVSRDEDPGTLFIAGSIHLLTDDEYPLPQPYEDAYKASDQVMFEIDMSKIDERKLQAMVMKEGAYQDGTKFKDHVSEKTYKRVVKFFADNEVPSSMFELLPTSFFKPWLLSTMISEMEHSKLGFKPDMGVDKHFEKRAVKDKKPTLGLETIEFQLGMFDSLSEAQQDRLVASTLDDLDKEGKNIDRMLAAWRSGSTKGFFEYMMDGFIEADQPIYETLLLHRNKAWIPEFKKLLKEEKTTLVVVGAGHLSGPDSVLALLEKEGFRLEQQSYLPSGKGKTPKGKQSKEGDEKKPKFDPSLID